MDDAVPVSSAQGARDLNRNRQGFGVRQRTAREPSRQCLALEELHDEIRRALLIADVVERTDVGMIELRDRAGFAIETLAKRRVLCQWIEQDFDRDGPLEAGATRPRGSRA